MKKTIIPILLVFVLLVIIFLVKQYTTNKSTNNLQAHSLNIRLNKNEYRFGEPISFTITNNTQKNVYYFPYTCATNLIQVFLILGNRTTPIQGESKICLLAPSVNILLPGNRITSKISENNLSEMVLGIYKIRFDYSTEKRDRFTIGDHSFLESETFKIVK